MLAGLPAAADAVEELAALVRGAGADDLADRLERALDDDVKLLALTLDERAIMLSALEDPPFELTELRAVLLADHQWRRAEGSTNCPNRCFKRRPARALDSLALPSYDPPDGTARFSSHQTGTQSAGTCRTHKGCPRAPAGGQPQERHGCSDGAPPGLPRVGRVLVQPRYARTQEGLVATGAGALMPPPSKIRPTRLAELRAVLLADHQWRQSEGLD